MLNSFDKANICPNSFAKETSPMGLFKMGVEIALIACARWFVKYFHLTYLLESEFQRLFCNFYLKGE